MQTKCVAKKVMVFEKVAYQSPSAKFVFLSIRTVVPNLFSLVCLLAAYFHKFHPSYKQNACN